MYLSSSGHHDYLFSTRRSLSVPLPHPNRRLSHFRSYHLITRHLRDAAAEEAVHQNPCSCNALGSRLPATTFSDTAQLGTSFDIANSPYLMTMVRWLGLGFTPLHPEILGPGEEEKVEDMDLGPVGASLIHLEI